MFFLSARTVSTVTGLLIAGAVLVQGATETNAINKPFAFRVVHGLVLGVDGKPASNRKVMLWPISRDAIGNPNARDSWSSWNFTTDAAGRFTAHFYECYTWNGENTNVPSLPGIGIYCFVVDSEPQDAGTVSPKICMERSYYGPDEWGVPKSIPKQGLNLTLRIHQGITVTGSVTDYETPHKPLPGIMVTVSHNVHVDTHTGAGGEVLEKSASTDEKGIFHLDHVYPALGTLSVSDLIWLKTKIGSKWTSSRNAEFDFAKMKSLSLQIRGATKPLFQYSGQVTDAHGSPISGTQLTFSYDTPGWPGEHKEEAETDQNGLYNVLLTTPWTERIMVEADGYKTGGLGWHGEDTKPGKHDFVLKKNGEK